ncbi:hypothetical protein VNG_0217H [Halobacterium salinarum NRC-1]|uniref:Domain of unknown function domain-containing protein n=2 Tax=Halobacterium salinarum TaxID=2242 RepID=Q9HSI2_HALSA|nr:hypothetical protein VNG_0217H [Halobacterium salinarum NRC-1]DAC77509.1 TPA_inf: uncharacterized protein VNG_0217H [Halobacterium salinarum NRC-1]
MLAPQDRNYLRGVSEYIDGLSRKAKYNRRVAIIDRITGTVEDFKIAHRDMSDRIWSTLTDLERQEEMRFKNGMIATIAFFYEYCETKGWDFEYILERGIEEAYTYGTSRDMPRRTVDKVLFEVDASEADVSREAQARIEEKIERGDELTLQERGIVQKMNGQLLQKLKAAKPDIENRHSKKKREQEALERVKKDIEMHGEPDSDGE